MPNIANAVAAIYRYPVKGLSAEKMHRVALTPRRMPAARSAFCDCARLDPLRSGAPLWLSKSYFLMLMRDEKLAQLQTRFDAESDVITISKTAGRCCARGSPSRKAAGWSQNFSPISSATSVKGPLRVVSAPGHAFADARRKPNATTDKYVSLINRASIAALEAAMGVPVDLSDFARMSISTGQRRGASTTGSIRTRYRRCAAASDLTDNPMRGNPSQSSHCNTRSRYRHCPRAHFRPH